MLSNSLNKLRVLAVLGVLAGLGGLCSVGRAEEATPSRTVGGNPGLLRIESEPPGAKVFVRTGGHNGYAEVGVTPLMLGNVEPGLLEYTLLRTDRQLYDGSLWIEAGKEHVEKAAMKPGRVFFVDQKRAGAADNNPGSEAQPWKTVNKAAQTLKAGDTVLAKEGEYEEKPIPPYVGIAVRPVNSGAEGAPIVFRAYPGHDVTIVSPKGSARAPRNGVSPLGSAYNQTYITFDGFTVGEKDGTEGSIAILQARGGIVVQNCVVVGQYIPTGDNHTGLTGWHSSGVLFRNCVVSGIKGDSQNSCGYKSYGARNSIIENCEFYDCRVAFHFKGNVGNLGERSENVIVRRNVFRDCARGLDCGSTKNVYYAQNLLYDIPGTTMGACNMSVVSDTYFHNNVAYSVGRVFALACQYEAAVRPLASFFNNVGSGAQQGGNFEGASAYFAYMDHNVFHQVGNWRKVGGFDVRSVEADPLFVDARGHDFHLRRGSPCIDAGRPVTYATGQGVNADTITVQHAYGFADPRRRGGMEGDLIQISKGKDAQYAKVVEVVDKTHLRLDKKVSWKEGDWVTFPFKGEAPDIGAYEFGDDRVIIGPTWKAYPKRVFSKDRKEEKP